MRTRARMLGVASVAVLTVATAACGDSDDAAAPATTTADAEAALPSGSLVGICPDKIVIQTDWFATPERAAAYQLVGPNGEIDAKAGAYRGPLGDTGVDVEVRLGGPFIGFSPVPQQMYTDTDITLGYVATADAVLGRKESPPRPAVPPLATTRQ